MLPVSVHRVSSSVHMLSFVSSSIRSVKPHSNPKTLISPWVAEAAQTAGQIGFQELLVLLPRLEQLVAGVEDEDEDEAVAVAVVEGGV